MVFFGPSSVIGLGVADSTESFDVALKELGEFKKVLAKLLHWFGGH